MFHAAAAPSVHFSALKAGQVAYIMRRFDLEAFFASLEKYEITDLVVVPPMAIAMIMSPLNKKYSLKKLKLAVCGAAPLDKGPQAMLKALLSNETPLTQVWGMTEASCIATMFAYPEQDTTGGVGRLIPNLEAKYVLFPASSPKLVQDKFMLTLKSESSMTTVRIYLPTTLKARSASVDPRSSKVISRIQKPMRSPLTVMDGTKPAILATVTEKPRSGTSLIGRRYAMRKLTTDSMEELT
jgi:acyl-CoA synthetase (AMP-forming)/AMP-acid ligase II